MAVQRRIGVNGSPTGRGRQLRQRRLAILGVLALLTAVGFPVIAGPAQAKVPGPNGRIAFARYDPTLDDTVTYTANPDGTHVHRLFPGASGSPHWSPDGSQVAIGACADPPVCDTAAVIVNPDTGRYRVLRMPDSANLFTGCPLWSPDATRLACEGDGQTDPGLNGIYTIRSSDGRGLTRVTSNPGGIDTPIDYSPDGRQLVFSRIDPTRPVPPPMARAASNAALFVVNTDGTGLHRITPWGFSDDDGSWSPDGTRIAFEHVGGLFVVHSDGAGLTSIPLAVHSLYGAGDVSWSPDGTKILFLLFAAGQEGMATANADGSNVQQVTISPTIDHQGDWGSHPTTH
jgi:Tol biopolymer transport system component